MLLNPGQAVFQRNVIARKIGHKPSSIRNFRKQLEKCRFLDKVKGVEVDKVFSIVFVTNWKAYQAEIIRGGILAIPTGQTEAARALGLTSTQTMRYVILPQALRIIIPPFTNEGINIILNSSLASAISAWELTRAARNMSSFYYLAFELYMAAALFYFVMAYSLARLTKKFEIRFRIPGLGIHHD